MDYKPKSLRDKKYPRFIYRESKDNYLVVGKTNITQNQFKLLFDNRRRVIANFIDIDKKWYCFFGTMDGLSGNEKAHKDTPHYHFISSAWGLIREDVLQQLMSERYQLTNSIHVFIKEDNYYLQKVTFNANIGHEPIVHRAQYLDK